jgi:hypothetical protein
MAEQIFTCETEWVAAYNNAKEQGETAQADFESNYGTNFTEYISKL